MANVVNDNIPFKVVKGTEEKIQARQNSEGCVYFTTDTKKIYLDTKTKRLLMGGNTGIYYGDENFGSSPGPDFLFSRIKFNGNLPNKDDLILNSDGCFYKVLDA
jgi:hypothetical protein